MLRTYHIYLAIVLILFASCSSYERDHHSVVKKWLDKEIYMPESLRYQIKDIPINYDFEDADFRGCLKTNVNKKNKHQSKFQTFMLW